MLPRLSGCFYPCGYFSGNSSFSSPGISNLSLKSFCMGARAPMCLGMSEVIIKKIILLYSLLVLLLPRSAILFFECTLKDVYV